MTNKKLYRSEENKVIAGVMGGIGEYFDIDPTIVRLVYVIIAIVSHGFPAVIGYIIAAIVIPKKPHVIHHVHHTEPTKEEPKS